MLSRWDRYFQESLESRVRAGCRRHLGTHTQLDRSTVVDFGSNDYLGLSQHSLVRQAASAELPSGSAASPVLLGYSQQQVVLEHEIGDLFETEAAVVFSSGYAANAGVLACLAGEGDLILSDQLNHASLIDGCRLSRARSKIYPHRDIDFVSQYLEKHREEFERVLILTETVFSMDGDLAPLAELVAIADKFDAGLVIDEAHALGIYGAEGAGLSKEVGVSKQTLLKLGTLSKSAGCVGGYAAGTRLVIDYLVNYCRSLIFSTAPSPPVLNAATMALRQMRSMDQDRAQLRQESRRLRSRLLAQGWRLAGDADADSPIIPVVIGDADRTRELGDRLLSRGIYVPVIRPPTVPEGTSRLRISLSTLHTESQIGELLDALGAEIN